MGVREECHNRILGDLRLPKLKLPPLPAGLAKQESRSHVKADSSVNSFL